MAWAKLLMRVGREGRRIDQPQQAARTVAGPASAWLRFRGFRRRRWSGRGSSAAGPGSDPCRPGAGSGICAGSPESACNASSAAGSAVPSSRASAVAGRGMTSPEMACARPNSSNSRLRVTAASAAGTEHTHSRSSPAPGRVSAAKQGGGSPSLLIRFHDYPNWWRMQGRKRLSAHDARSPASVTVASSGMSCACGRMSAVVPARSRRRSPAGAEPWPPACGRNSRHRSRAGNPADRKPPAAATRWPERGRSPAAGIGMPWRSRPSPADRRPAAEDHRVPRRRRRPASRCASRVRSAAPPAGGVEFVAHRRAEGQGPAAAAVRAGLRVRDSIRVESGRGSFRRAPCARPAAPAATRREKRRNRRCVRWTAGGGMC
jgi:hypothetical protein